MGDVNENQDVTVEETQNPQGTEGGQTLTLEEFLATEENKSAYDTAVSEAVAAALEKKQAEDAEAKRLENLSQEEKTAEKEKELQEREARLQAAELKSEAVIAFGKAGIPAKLAECLNYSSKEAYEKSRAAAMDAFKEAVQAGINERLRGKTLPTATDGKKTAERVSSTNDLKALIKENQARR